MDSQIGAATIILIDPTICFKYASETGPLLITVHFGIEKVLTCIISI